MIPDPTTVRRRLLGASVVAVLSVGVAAVAASPGPPQAWIDDPLAWTTVTSVPVTVVAHATDPDGVVSVRLSVDGAPAATVDASGDTLVTVELVWTPPGPGIFILEVVGVDPSGEEGVPDSEPVRVDLGDEATTTTVLRPTTTTAPRSTTTAATATTATTTIPTTIPTTTTLATTTTVPATTPTTGRETTTTGRETTTTVGRTTTTGR